MPIHNVIANFNGYHENWWTNHHVARLSDGTTVVVFLRDAGGGVPQLFFTSSSNLTDWTEPLLIGDGGACRDGSPELAVDSQDNIHVVWLGLNGYDLFPLRHQVEYRRRTVAGGWEARVGLTNANLFHGAPRVVVDAVDAVRVVYNILGTGLRYIERTAAGWQPVEVVPAAGAPAGTVQLYSAIDVDDSGRLHLLFVAEYLPDTHVPKYTSLYYTRRVAGLWATPELVSDPIHDIERYRIALLGDDHVVALFSSLGAPSFPALTNIAIRERTAGWAPIQYVTDDDRECMLNGMIVDTNGNLNVYYFQDTILTLPTLYSRTRRGGFFTWDGEVTLNNLLRPGSQINARFPIFSVRTNTPSRGFSMLFGFDAALDGWRGLHFYDGAAFDVPAPIPTSVPKVLTLPASRVDGRTGNYPYTDY